MNPTKGGLQAKVNMTGVQVAHGPTDAIKEYFKDAKVRERFNEMLGKKSAGFFSSIISLVASNKSLQTVNQASIVASAAMAAALDLPVNQSLGFAWIVPYKGRAQFQIGWRGYVQLAQRSGMYRHINMCVVHEGELENYNKFTGEIKLGDQKSDKVVGYFAEFELLNGFKKSSYWTIEELDAFAAKYSKAYHTGIWKEEHDKMALKTVLTHLLKDWGPLSIDMQKAYVSDEKEIKVDESSGSVTTIDTETGEILDGTTIDNQDDKEDTESLLFSKEGDSGK